MKATDVVTLSIRLPSQLVRRAKVLAKRDDRSLASVIRQSLDEYLKNH